MMFDAELLDKNDATITATGNGPIRNVAGIDRAGYAVVVTDTVTGSSPTLDVTLKFSEDADMTDIREQVDFPQIIAAGIHWLSVAPRRGYMRATFTVGGSASPTFPGVYAGLVRGEHRKNRQG